VETEDEKLSAKIETIAKHLGIEIKWVERESGYEAKAATHRKEGGE
jgi:hypothetical protein